MYGTVSGDLRSQGSSEVTDIDFLAILLEYNILPKSKIVYSNLQVERVIIKIKIRGCPELVRATRFYRAVTCTAVPTMARYLPTVSV